MDLVGEGRGVRVTHQFRRIAEAKLAKVTRLAPRALRAELEVTPARSANLDGLKRLDATLDTPRKTFRARADGADLEATLDQVVSRLDRQVREHKKKTQDRL